MNTSEYSTSILVILIITFKAFCQFEALDNINNIYGMWSLQTVPVLENPSISPPFESPVATLSFEKCNDSLETRRLNPNIKRLREKDIFKNIRVIEFDTSGKVMDTAYWVSEVYKECSIIDVGSHSKKDKKFFHILRFTKDSLVSAGNEVYIKKTVSDAMTKRSQNHKKPKIQK